MDIDQLSGVGQVREKGAAQVLGEFAFDLALYQRPGSVLKSYRLSVDLDANTAMRAMNNGKLLELDLGEGRIIDFNVTRFQLPDGPVEVTATGAIHAP